MADQAPPAVDSKDAEKTEETPQDDSALSDAELAFKWMAGRVRTAFGYLKPAVLRKHLEAEATR